MVVVLLFANSAVMILSETWVKSMVLNLKDSLSCIHCKVGSAKLLASSLDGSEGIEA